MGSRGITRRTVDFLYKNAMPPPQAWDSLLFKMEDIRNLSCSQGIECLTKVPTCGTLTSQFSLVLIFEHNLHGFLFKKCWCQPSFFFWFVLFGESRSKFQTSYSKKHAIPPYRRIVQPQFFLFEAPGWLSNALLLRSDVWRSTCSAVESSHPHPLDIIYAPPASTTFVVPILFITYK